MTENVIPIHNNHPNGTTSTAYYNFEEDPSFEKRHAHVRQALEQLYENSQPHSDDDDDSQYLQSTLISPVQATNVTMDSGNGNYHATVTFTEDDECNGIPSGSNNSSSAGFSLSDIDSSSSVSSLLSLGEGDKERRRSDEELKLQNNFQDRHLNLKNRQYIPTTERLVHPPNISFDTMGPDQLRQSLNNASASLEPCANQVELDNMRRVAEQIQSESDEKVKHLEEINDRLNQQLLSLQQETRNNNMNAYGDNNSGETEEYWKNSFNTLVEHLCDLEETGAWKSQSIRIDKIILDSMNNHNHAILSSGEMIGDRLRRLSQSNRKKARKKSMSDDDLNQTVSSTLSHERFVSVSVNTDDLKTNRFQSIPFQMDENQINQLLIENANLKESHEQLREQISDYQGQVQSLQGFKEQLLSPSSAIETCHDDDTLKAMKKTNAMLSLQNSMLADEKEVILEENLRLARRGAELERLAEDATMECERCFERLREVDAHLQSLEKSNDDLTVQIRKWKENYHLQETENLEIFDEMSKEIEDTKRGFEALKASKSIFQDEVEKLKAEKISLQSKADKSTTEIRNIKAAFECEKESLLQEIHTAKSNAKSSSIEMESLKDQIQTIENQSKQIIEDLASSRQSLEAMSNERDSLMKIEQTLSDKVAALKNQVQSMSTKNIELQDECVQLRDANALMKSNIDEKESENVELENRITAMEKVLASSRTENVRLSDSKSDVELQLSHLEDEMRLLRDYKAQSESQKEELTKIIVQKDAQMNELRLKVDKVLSEKAKSDSEMNQFKKAVITYRDEVEKEKENSNKERLTLQNAVETGLRELQSTKKELDNAQNEKDVLQKSTMSYSQQVDALLHQNEQLSVEINELKATVSNFDALSTENDIMKQKCIELQNSVEEYRTKIENQQTDLDELQSKFDNMVAQNTETKLQLDNSLKENEVLSCQIEELRGNLDSTLTEVDNLVVSKKDIICEKELLEKNLSHLQSKVDDQAERIACREGEMEVLTRDIEDKNQLIEGLQKAISVYKDELGALLIAKRRSLQGSISGKTPVSINANDEKDVNTEDFSTVTRTPLTELNLTANAPSTAKSGLSTVKSSLFTVEEQPSSINLSNDDPIDAMLERIQLMSQRTIRSHKALGDKSEKICEPLTCDNHELEDESSDDGETEAFVRGVLERVGNL